MRPYLLLPLVMLLSMVADVRGEDLAHRDLDVPGYDLGLPFDASVAAMPSAEPSSIISAAPSAPASIDVAKVEAEAKAATAAAGELGAAIRTRSLPGVLVALSLLLLAVAKGLAAIGVAKTQRAEAVLMVLGGVAAAAAYLGWADESALRETKATLLGLTGGGAVGVAVLVERLGLGDALARLLGRKVE